MNKNITHKIQNVINGNYCIGCGVCAVQNKKNIIKHNEYNLIDVKLIEEDGSSDKVCPFTSLDNEDTIADQEYKNIEHIKHDKKLGYYLSLHAGNVTNQEYRIKSSSGGLTTWLLKKLLDTKEIDAVIHVGKSSDKDSSLFEYSISKTIEEVNEKSKSKYYPTSLEKVLNEIEKAPYKKYAIVGVPCYIKAVRLLCLQNNIINERIKFFLGIYCGHLKSAAFSELLAWQQGINPSNLKSIDFRVKNKNAPATQYSIEAESINNIKVIEKNKNLIGTDWGLGYFKPNACDWCDDISAETADVVFGDAWINEYEKNYQGTNILIIRNSLIQNIFNEGLKNLEIELKQLSKEKIISSQAGNYRHRQEGLSLRIKDAKKAGIWHPVKRVKEDDYAISSKRKEIYRIRRKLSSDSHSIFLKAKKRNSLLYFILKTLPLELKYYYLNKTLIKNIIKLVIKYSYILRRKAFKSGKITWKK